MKYIFIMSNGVRVQLDVLKIQISAISETLTSVKKLFDTCPITTDEDEHKLFTDYNNIHIALAELIDKSSSNMLSGSCRVGDAVRVMRYIEENESDIDTTIDNNTVIDNTATENTNMEMVKILFFDEKYSEFESLIRGCTFFKAEYKFPNESIGPPSFMAKNLLNGFIRRLNNMQSKLMVCFRCLITDDLDTNKYIYTSHWIVDSIALKKSGGHLKHLVGTMIDDFDVECIVDENDIKELLNDIRMSNMNDIAIVGEKYA